MEHNILMVLFSSQGSFDYRAAFSSVFTVQSVFISASFAVRSFAPRAVLLGRERDRREFFARNKSTSIRIENLPPQMTNQNKHLP